MKLERKFTEEEIGEIMYCGGVSDEEGNSIFITIEKECVDNDTEKNSAKFNVIIQEVSTGRFFETELGQSQWYKQGEHNASQEWFEVFPKTITKTIYTRYE